MGNFKSYDGTLLAFDVAGSGEPLVVLPGGPMQSPAYLGDLGGLTAYRSLHLLNLRGTGGSAVPDDPASYSIERQVDDVEAFRVHLGLDTIDLLAHCGGAAIAMLYAARHPDRIRRLALITPSLRVLGFGFVEANIREGAALRAGRPGMDAVMVALDNVLAGTGTPEDEQALTPLTYGRWDAAAQAHAAAQAGQQNETGAAGYYGEGMPEPDAVKKALAELDAPVLLLAGELDGQPRPSVTSAAATLFPRSETAVVPGGGHFPWLDDPSAFTTSVAGFLGR